jgi:hypothetical protein
VSSLNFKVGDIIIIKREAYEGAYEGQIGYVKSIPFTSFSYVKLFNHESDELLFRNNEFELYSLTTKA